MLDRANQLIDRNVTIMNTKVTETIRVDREVKKSLQLIAEKFDVLGLNLSVSNIASHVIRACLDNEAEITLEGIRFPAAQKELKLNAFKGTAQTVKHVLDNITYDDAPSHSFAEISFTQRDKHMLFGILEKTSQERAEKINKKYGTDYSKEATKLGTDSLQRKLKKHNMSKHEARKQVLAEEKETEVTI
jgi:hypothetical protein